VALSVGNLDDRIRWYRDVLGLEEMFRQDSDDRRMVVLQFPGSSHTLGLVEHPGAVAGFDPRTMGLDHLAFSVTSGEELAAWAGRLGERGVAHSGPVETPFGGMLHFEDPDGIALALFWDRQT
jgi:catechol-2,3-dioxygenase